ncbi:MAG: hypothetical protein FWG73_08300 [Planctomycetaceae bacterium]|nr:hypothetical protein [Planctomycetaceae bacterium]
MKALSYTLLLALLAFSFNTAVGQDAMLAIRDAAAKELPLQSDVEIDPISASEIPACELIISADRRHMTLLSPQKVMLRRFSDTDGDPQSQVDQWSFYQNGVEVYRELDTTGNGKRDQFRWLNTAGTRWGVDTTGNNAIDTWKEISAEEVSREIILALATNDAQRFAAVALKESELRNLGLGEVHNSTAAQKIPGLQTGFAAAVSSLALSNTAQWHQLSAMMPGTVPQGEQGNQKDLRVYENATATVSESGNVRQILIGTLVQIGENNWRVLDLPKNYDVEQLAYTFIQPVLTPGSTGPADSEIVAMMNQIAALQSQIPTLPEADRPDKHKEVIAILLEIVKIAATQDERENWIRQIADTIMQAVGRNEYPDGKEQIAALFATVNQPTMQELAAHVRSRQIMVEYCIALESGSDPMRAYTQWLADLEDMVTAFPTTEAGLDGMMQLASYKEMLEPTNTESIRWYRRVIELVPGQPQAAKAQGAIRRLNAEGNEVPFRGFSDTAGRAFDIAEYRDNFVLLCFWDSHSAGQLPIIKAVLDRFESAELVPIGVNLDNDESAMQTALQNAPAGWRQLYAPGGLDGALATYWGIISPPSMILYDKAGRVVRSSITSVEDLQQVLTDLVQ